MRFGAVSYLNALPLIEGLEPITLDTPSGLARRVTAGEIDVSLLPVAAGAPLGLPRVGGLGIAAEGPVDSVLLFLRRPVAELQTIRLDPETYARLRSGASHAAGVATPQRSRNSISTTLSHPTSP